MRKLRLEEIPRAAPDQVTDGPRHPISVVVDNVRSIYNVGSIFRTSDAALVEHVYLTGYTGTPEHRGLRKLTGYTGTPEHRGLRKTALGAEKTVPWSHHTDPADALAELRATGHTIAALEITNDPVLPSALPARAFPLALIVGNEVDGVRSSLVQQADLALELPQFGVKHSLNVAVAYGIAVYDLVRRYRAVIDPAAHPLPTAPRSL
jgi:tRNA G18 (ribose-2'-O)-methylase SpoU